MECKWHPDQQAELTCFQCGQQFCRECVKETGETNICPDCHKAELERFATQLGPEKRRAKPKKEKPPKEPKVKAKKEKKPRRRKAAAEIGEAPVEPFLPPEPAAVVDKALEEPALEVAEEKAALEVTEKPKARAKKEKLPKEQRVKKEKPLKKPKKEKPPKEPRVKKEKRKERRQLRKPAEKIAGPPPAIDEVKEPPPPSVAAEEKAAFWGDVERPEEAVRETKPEAPPELKVEPSGPAEEIAEPEMEAAVERAEATEKAEAVEPAPVEAPEVEPVPEKEEPKPEMTEAEAAGLAFLIPDSEAESEPSKEEAAAPEEEEEEAAALEAVPAAPTDEEELAAELTAEKRPLFRRRKKKAAGEGLVAMQVPDEYEGEVTVTPSYLKAVLWGLLAGLLGAGAYMGIARLLGDEYGVAAMLIGVAVGLAVVFGSGRHFSWKLGLIAAVISLFFVSAGRILVYMLEVWFPRVLDLPVGNIDNFNYAIKLFWRELPTRWLIFLLLAGGTAFLLSFRPWPVKLRVSGEATGGREAGDRA